MEKEIYLLGQHMRIKVTEENGTKNIEVLPFPESHDAFLASTNAIDGDSLQILWSKHHFGIAHRTQMFMVLYRTFVDAFHHQSTIDDALTLQALYCDMIVRLGTILEDFAGMCSACKAFSLHGTSIAETFLAFSDPVGFYNQVGERAPRVIKQIFRLAQSKGNLERLFRDLTEEEKEVLWKGINMTTEIIQELMVDISKAIRRENRPNVTYYDMYNKLKHGFAPIYPYAIPLPFEIKYVPLELENEEIIRYHMMEGITIMHDKTAGQRTTAEAEKYQNLKLATPTLTFEPVNLEAADTMRIIVEKIDSLFRYLVNIYLSYSQGNKRISLKCREGMLTEEEQHQILTIIEDESRYI